MRHDGASPAVKGEYQAVRALVLVGLRGDRPHAVEAPQGRRKRKGSKG